MWESSIGEAKAHEPELRLGLVRPSIGLEHYDDLVEDIDRALDAAN